MVSGTQDYIADIACKTDIHVSLFNVIYYGCSGAENLKRILKIKYHLNITRFMYYLSSNKKYFKEIASVSKGGTCIVIQLLNTCRSISREIVHLLDGDGVKRRKQRRLRRRQYFSKVNLYLPSIFPLFLKKTLLIHSFIETRRTRPVY